MEKQQQQQQCNKLSSAKEENGKALFVLAIPSIEFTLLFYYYGYTALLRHCILRLVVHC